MNTNKKTENIISLMERDNSIDAPPDSIKWAKNLFLSRAAKPKRFLMQQIRAVLQMDLSPDRAAFGERSASATQVRQMLFAAGDNSIDLRITGTKNGAEIHGQILGEGFEDAAVRIFDASTDFETSANDAAEFRFEKVSAGTYTLSVIGKEAEIVIEGIDLS